MDIRQVLIAVSMAIPFAASVSARTPTPPETPVANADAPRAVPTEAVGQAPAAAPEAAVPSVPVTDAAPVTSKTEAPAAEAGSAEAEPPRPPAPQKRRARAVAASEPGGSLLTMVKVLAALSKEGSGNVVLSPYGFELAGELLLAGAGGDTRREWMLALGYPAAATPDVVAGLAKKRREALQQDDTATLSFAAAAWSSVRTPLRAEFIERIRTDHGSHAATVDFGDPATLATINGWFREQTRGRVPELIDRLSADTHAVLGSALFFEGKWLMPFDPTATRDDAFQSADGDIQVPTMRRRFEGLPYCARNDMQAVRLPFVGGHYEMTIVLPAAGKALPPRAPSDWLAPDCYKQQAVEFSMPRLSLQGDASLIDPLRAAGLSTALGPKPDYKAMTDAGFVPDRILQKTVLKIDEAGAEAAAATAIIGTRSVAIQKPAITMAVNRPYYVILRHAPSDTMLALALVRKPQ